jgi:hypothetical protein
MRFERSIRASFVAVVATLAVGGVGLRWAMQRLDVYLRKEPVELRGSFGTIPITLGRWKKVGDDVVMDAATVEQLGTQQYLTRNYALDGDVSKGVLMLHLAYYTGMIDTVPHIPERCWGANGLIQKGEPMQLPVKVDVPAEAPPGGPVNRATGEPYRIAGVEDPVTGAKDRVALPIGDLGFTLSTFQDPHQPRIDQLGGYMFIANGRATATTFGVRSLAFSLSDRFAYFCKLQLSARYPVGERPSSEIFREQSEDFLRELLPHLMRRLPDWPSVEASRSPSATGT